MIKQYLFKYRYPQSINIELMDTCNLRCKHCYIYARDNISKRFMDYNLFKQIIDKLSFLLKKSKHISFSSVEGLYHKDFFNMLDYIKTNIGQISIPIYTNGMLLNEHNIRQLLDREMDSYVVSLDGCKKKTVEDFKNGTDFDRVVENIKRLRYIGGNDIDIFVKFVAHKNNIGELLDYIDFCNDLGVDGISINGLAPYGKDMEDVCLFSESGMPDVDQLYLDARDKAKSLGMRLTKFPLTKPIVRGCNADKELYIDIDGNVIPCVLFKERTCLTLFGESRQTKPIVYGNVLVTNPYEIWMDKSYIDFRKKLQDGVLPDMCRLCAMGHGVVC